MHNEDIHKDLDKFEIRDFLSKQLRDELCGCGFYYDIEQLETYLDKAQKQLKHAKSVNAIKHLIETLGWKDFDISDIVGYDPKTYFTFLGTNAEFEKVFGCKYDE